MMKFFLDTEFIEDGETIDLLSLGAISEDGREFYRESSEANLTKADAFVREHVFSNMTWEPSITRTRKEIALDFFHYVENVPREKQGNKVVGLYSSSNPEFWAYYADYDWVAVCQLFGRMLDLPHGWPKYCHDFKQVVDERNLKLKKLMESVAHNALTDARWLRTEYKRLVVEGGNSGPWDFHPACRAVQGMTQCEGLKDHIGFHAAGGVSFARVDSWDGEVNQRAVWVRF